MDTPQPNFSFRMMAGMFRVRDLQCVLEIIEKEEQK